MDQEQIQPKSDPNTQSVYIADKDMVKNYPRGMSNDQIEYDVHTSVRGNSPEDYFVNFLPLKEVQQAWSFLGKNKEAIMDSAGQALKSSIPPLAIPGLLKFEREQVDPAFKYAVTGDLESVYKPWLQIWRESEIGKVATQASDQMLADAPTMKVGLPGSKDIAGPMGLAAGMVAGEKQQSMDVPYGPKVIPWFLSEYAPEQLLEFGTKASSWIAGYGIEKGIQKFGPPIIDKLMRLLPEDVSAAMQKDIFGKEQALKWAHETLGTSPNDKTSVIQKAYRQAAEATHPDIVGGSGDEFKTVNEAYSAIIENRKGVMSQFYDAFRSSELAKAEARPTAAPAKSRGIRLNSFPVLPEYNEGDLVRVGNDAVKLLKITGNIATVNMAGKVMDLPLGQIQRMPVSGIAEYEKLQQMFDKHLDDGDIIPGSDPYLRIARDKIDLLIENYKAAVLKDYPGTTAPVVSNTDLFRTADFAHFPKFESTMSKSRHAFASAMAKVYDEILLSDPKTANLPNLVTVGAAGASKTGTLRHAIGDLAQYRFVKDTNVASPKSGERIFDMIRSFPGNQNIEMLVVYRDPEQAWVNGVIKRMFKNPERRIVTVDDWINTNKSYKAFLDLWAKYKDDPTMQQNIYEAITDAQPEVINLKQLEEKIAAQDPGKIKKRMVEAVTDLNKEGRITDDELSMFLTGEVGNVSKGEVVKGGIGSDQKGIGKLQETVAGGTKNVKAVEAGGSSGTGKEAAAINKERLKVSKEAKETLDRATTAVADEIQNQTGTPLSHKEVIEAAKSAEILSKGASREATLAFEASLLKTRQHLAALAEQNQLTPEFLDTLRIAANHGTDIARSLESMKIEAIPEYAATKIKLIKNLIKLGKTSEEILKAAQGVDFKSEAQVAKFYREFVKPTLPEILDEFAYMNILSSPLTHIVNTFSNVIQLAGLNPLTKLASGAIDTVVSGLTGADRAHYIADVQPFYKGAINAIPDAIQGAVKALQGNKNLERPDVTHLPTLSKFVDVATLGVGKYIPRALEASDIFFRTMVEAGEVEAKVSRLGHTPSDKEMVQIQKEARASADYYVFRNKPDTKNATGQGHILTWLDQGTQGIYALRRIPGFKWFVRFVQTPMNILKQGLEYSPAGFSTLPGAKDKTEQGAKSIIGSLVFAGASWLAAAGLTTWSAPKDAKGKNDFYNAGMIPYAVRIGDKWVSYSKLGPLSYPIAMAAALHYFTKESPDALSDSEMDKMVAALTGIMGFFSDQSYMSGLGDLVNFASGERTKAITNMPTQMIPLSSLQGWINNLIDPLQRKAEKGLSFKSMMDQIQMKLVGMSQFVPPQMDMNELPVKKQNRVINAVSPLKTANVDKAGLSDYRDAVRTKQELNKIKKELSK